MQEVIIIVSAVCARMVGCQVNAVRRSEDANGAQLDFHLL